MDPRFVFTGKIVLVTGAVIRLDGGRP